LGTLTLQALSEVTLAVVGSRPGFGRTQRVAFGEIITIGPPLGARLYVSALGGFDALRVLGSASGAPLVSGDILKGVGCGHSPDLRIDSPLQSLLTGPIRILRGPDFDKVASDGLKNSYTVSVQSNRLGVRLEGNSLGNMAEIVSQPACPGSLEVTGGGTPILLGPDGPTLGGYPQAGVVCDVDFDRLGQLVPGQEVRFEWINREVATLLRLERRTLIERRLAAIRLAREK
jgi:allophanate hydrolase subunit 2